MTTTDTEHGDITVDGVRVIDADTHLSEPPDFFTARLPKKWHAIGPRTEIDRNGDERWRIGDRRLSKVGALAPAGSGEAASEWNAVQSGYGFIPYLLEALDWQWVNPGTHRQFPHRLLPSEYFRRQVYAVVWFEQKTLPLLRCYPDNVMFETDFPHDTSLVPGPGSESPAPADIVAQHIADYGAELMQRVMYDNAARVYRL